MLSKDLEAKSFTLMPLGNNFYLRRPDLTCCVMLQINAKVALGDRDVSLTIARSGPVIWASAERTRNLLLHAMPVTSYLLH